MSDRGMKKWNAYKALPEHDVAINGEYKKKEKVEKPLISQEEAEIINEILVSYNGEELIITYYRGGYLYTIADTLKKVDPYEKRIVTTNNGKVAFRELVKLKVKE